MVIDLQGKRFVKMAGIPQKRKIQSHSGQSARVQTLVSNVRTLTAQPSNLRVGIASTSYQTALMGLCVRRDYVFEEIW